MSKPVWVDEVYTPPKVKKYCFVPSCKNNSEKKPDKHYFYIPNKNNAEWCRAVGKTVIPKRPLFICEDHLDLEYDLENYESWTKFKCPPKLRPSVPFLKKISIPTETITRDEAGPSRLPKEMCFQKCQPFQDNSIMCLPTTANKSTQEKPIENSIMCFPITADKSTQVKPIMKDSAINCNILQQQTKPGACNISQPSRTGSTSEISESEASQVSYAPSTSSTSTSCASCATHAILNGRQFMLGLIEQKPFQYIGIPKKLYWMLDNICNAHRDITKLGIIITLYKIKNDDTFMRIGDLFEISQSTLWRMFEKTLALLSVFFNQFIVWPSAIEIKENLPGAFTANVEYSNIQSIIDAFEIEIEKPSNPLHQSLTWSQYKNCNTLKYLISATPDGLINFISKGYGGRISDVSLVEESGFLDVVPSGSYVLADRGFKHLETILSLRSIRLLRPPSVFSGKILTKTEVIKAKLIASLRIHIERVIRRVRVFKFLKPHAVINNKCTAFVDNAVLVACGAINLQAPIIKRE